MIRTRTAVQLSLLGLLVGLLPVGAHAVSSDESKAAAGGLGAVEVSETFRGQKLHWQPCFPEPVEGLPPGSERLECSSMSVPMDWEKQDGKTLDIAVSRLRPESGEPKDLILTNPGGPGEEGVVVPLLFLNPTHAEVANSSEIVGMDVRGTGQSTNITCNGESIGHERDVRDRSRANVNKMLDDVEAFADACQTGSGELGQHINTAQTVHDLDLLRELLGYEQTNWFGFSAGTWLGAHYATAFPARTGNFVFDSSVRFTGTWQQIYALQPMGFERRFRQDFLPWAATHHERYGLGETSAKVRQSYETIRAALAEAPLNLGDTVLTATMLDSMISGNLYSKASFPGMADTLGQLYIFLGPGGAQEKGDAGKKSVTPDAAEADELADLTEGLTDSSRVPGAKAGAPDAIDATFYTVGCNDTSWFGNRQTLKLSSAVQGKMFPLLGWRSIAEPCVFWDRPDVDLPKPDGEGVSSVLMVHSEHDPTAPLEGARSAAARFDGARLLTVTNEGDHMLYGTGNSCVDNAVNTYLTSGELPKRGATCAGTGLPEPTNAEAADGPSASTQQRLSKYAGGLAR